MLTPRRALRFALRLLAAVMVGGTVALGPRTHAPRLPQRAQVVLVVEAHDVRR